MSTTTRQSSLARITDALATHGWTFTVDHTVSVLVPDTTTDIAPRWAQRQRHPRVQDMGTAVRFDNEVEVTHNSIGERVSGTLYFTENGAYLPEMTSGGYPISAKMSLKEVESILAKRAPERQRSLQAERKVRNKAAHEAKVAEAHEAVAQAATAAQAADAEAQEAVMEHVPGIDRAEASRILSALEADTRISAARIARHNLQAASESVLRAQNDLAYSARNDWSWG